MLNAKQIFYIFVINFYLYEINCLPDIIRIGKCNLKKILLMCEHFFLFYFLAFIINFFDAVGIFMRVYLC